MAFPPGALFVSLKLGAVTSHHIKMIAPAPEPVNEMAARKPWTFVTYDKWVPWEKVTELQRENGTRRPSWRFFFRGLRELCRAAARSLTVYFETLTGEDLVPGISVAVQTSGDRINSHPHLHLL